MMASFNTSKASMPFLSKDLFFVHIPKTGGMTIQKSFKYEHPNFLKKYPVPEGYQSLAHNWEAPDKKRYVLSHLTVQQIIDLGWISKSKFKSISTFSIVRNPWDRVCSLYYTHGQSNRKQRSFKQFLTEIKESAELCKKGISLPIFTKEISNMACPQKLLLSYNGEILVKDIYKFEEHPKVYDMIKEKLNRDIHVGVENKTKGSRPKHYSTLYTEPYQVDLVGEIFKEDIDYFGYTYESI